MAVLFAEGDSSQVQVAEAMWRRGGGKSVLALSSLEASEGEKDELLSSSMGRFSSKHARLGNRHACTCALRGVSWRAAWAWDRIGIQSED
jgi:hypothetical protein